MLPTQKLEYAVDLINDGGTIAASARYMASNYNEYVLKDLLDDSEDATERKVLKAAIKIAK